MRLQTGPEWCQLTRPTPMATLGGSSLVVNQVRTCIVSVRGQLAHLDWTVIPHDVIVYPESTQDVVQIVQLAIKYRIPIVPYSGGTSLEGHITGVAHFFTVFLTLFLSYLLD